MTHQHQREPAATPLSRDATLGGWPPTPPDVLLRQGSVERMRLRSRARLAERRPAAHAWLGRNSARYRAAIDRLLPRRRILGLTVLVVVLTLFDAAATTLVVLTGLAVEANPLLASIVDTLGVVPAMLGRALVGVGLAWGLGWLASWRRGVRPVVPLVALVLSAVACVHLWGIALALLDRR